ncbi:MAG: DUF4263 domain-containing protein [Xanthomonadaceae bacterium]|nr:DUF4263 domain-containing protein [Xanthomonadaceae bacterium]
MSIDHKFEIDGDPRYKLVFNFSGADSEIGNPALFKGAFYAYDKNNGTPAFTCNIELKDIFRLYDHLSAYSFIRKKRPPSNEKFLEVTTSPDQLIQMMEYFSNDAVVNSIKHIVTNRLSSSDINTILGRKEALKIFEEMLYGKKSYQEKTWQSFFERNEWIFGYGLKYRYLRILQRESRVGKGGIDGKGDVVVDFLLGDSRFTKLIELKKPDTKLFKSRKNRSDSWSISSDLTDSVSQILAQKANWEIESNKTQYSTTGKRIVEASHDVECILVVGLLSAVDGSDLEKSIKLKTIELFRRNLRNIEIITYDELLERAKFIVNLPDSQIAESED